LNRLLSSVVLDPDIDRRHRRLTVLALLLSALLHLGFALGTWLVELRDIHSPAVEQVVDAELVMEPQKPKPAPAPKPEPPKPEPPKPEPPKPEAPKPEAPPKPEHRPEPIAPVQLQRARVAEKSSAPAPSRPAIRPAGDTGLFMSDSPDAKAEALAKNAGELTQSAQDFILAQFIRMWHFNFRAARGHNFSIGAAIVINRDGTLAGPMSKNAPWDPEAVIPGYNSMSGYPKEALESFLLALRMAQPLDLPPDDGKGWPRRMVLKFRLDDL
jgi:hypothetical protein